MEDLDLPVGAGELNHLGGAAAGVEGLDHLLDKSVHRPLRAAVGGQELLADGEVGRQVGRQDFGSAVPVRPADADLDVEAARPQDRRVDHVLTVGGADDHDVVELVDAVDLGEHLRDDGGLHVRGAPGPAGAEQGVHLVEEDDDGHAGGRLLPGSGEDDADAPLGLSHVLVQQLGALDVEEVGLAPAARPQGGGDGLGDEGLAASGRPVEQHPARWGEPVLAVEVGVEEGQLDGVADELDLLAQSPDVAVSDVGHLLQDELLDLGAHHGTQCHAHGQVGHEGVTDPGAVVAQGLREAEDLLLVVAGQDQDGAVVVGLLDGDDLPEARRGAGGGDDEVLVEDDVVARVQGGGHDGGPDAHPVAPPGDGDVSGACGGVHGQDRGVRQGWELKGLDVLVQGRQLLACRPQGVGQVGVLTAEHAGLLDQFAQAVGGVRRRRRARAPLLHRFLRPLVHARPP